ncbi:MAG: site-specific DNA-methyltransferase [Treponema sp.]|nr:site-specific DNA-methyltransferase [Treponema sp.]
MIEKLDGMTKDIVKDNIEKLKELFPSIVTDNKINFRELELLLGQDVSNDKEQYTFVWNGKTEATKIAQKRSTGTLIPCEKESECWDKTNNIYIEGDNLEVLKLLQSSYNGKIKIIYIDPPYNTGHDFVYKDNFNDNISNYKEVTGQAQKSNADTDGRYHTNWLNMMYPRLKLARNLLADDGAIFISIDDNEQTNLKKICDDIFGENNFVGCISVKGNPRGRQSSSYLAQVHDFLIVYRKTEDLELIGFDISEEDIKKRFNKKDENGEIYEEWELRKRGADSRREDSPNLWFPIYYSEKLNDISLEKKDTYTISIVPKLSDGTDGRWRWSKEKVINEKSKLYVRKNTKGVYNIYEKKLVDEKSKQLAPTIWDYSDVNTELGTKLLKQLFANRNYFDFPKPVGLIKRIIEMFDDKNLTVLDFFSGSATTAHATMEVNSKDGGHRKYICVQLPAKLEETSDAYKDGYSNLCEIAKERIRRAGKKIVDELKVYGREREIEGKRLLSSGTAGDLDHVEYKDVETGEITSESRFIHEPKDIYKYNPEKLDIGFKVFKLDSSNLKKWNNTPTKDAEEVANRIRQISFDYLEDGRTEIDLVYEIMLKYGIDLTLPVTQTANGKGYIVNGEDINCWYVLK